MNIPGRLGLALILALAGCSGASVRSQSPEELLSEDAGPPGFVGDLASAAGMHAVKVESVALVTNLNATGSDPPPSFERAAILSEMQVRGVDNPNRLLASGTASVALTIGYLRPGIEKGDHFDIELRIPSRSETTSLRGGWLMETRLKELGSVNQQLREGTLWAIGHGPVLVDPAATEGVALGRGRVLGGGVALRSRSLGLVLKPDHQSVPKSSLVGRAVNQRFFTFVSGLKQGVAKPLNDEYIELRIHPQYKHNIARYMQVVRAIPLRETPAERLDRLQVLEKQLLDPATADTAAIRLEAIGKEGVAVLERGIESSDPLVRFHAAEALAYLDQPTASEPLKLAARDEPAFRSFALTALSAIRDYSAYDALRELLASPSAETRYGAFRALWAMNSEDPFIRGQLVNDQFHYHHLDVPGPPMVHITHNVRPELVLFGQPPPLESPLLLEGGSELMVRSTDDGQLSVTRFRLGEDERQLLVPNDWDALIGALGELGANYPDVVQMLQQAKQKHLLACRLEVDAVPEAGRTYLVRGPGLPSDTDPEELADHGSDTPEEGPEVDSEMARSGVTMANPNSDLFPKAKRLARKSADQHQARAERDEETEEKKGGPLRRAVGRMRQ